MIDFLWDIVLPIIGLLCVALFVLLMIIAWDKDEQKDCLTESDLYNKHKRK